MGKWIFLLLLGFSFSAGAQQNWNGKKAAIVLTYDDALKVHLEHAVPALDSLGLKGTFYLSDYFGGLQAQLAGWKKAAATGHELGNHTVFHPCLGNLPGRSFVSADYDLSKYSFRRITDEIRAMNTLLKAIDGRTERTFAFPCSDTRIRDTPYFTPVQREFVAARAVRTQLELLPEVDLYNLSAFMVNGQSGAELIAMVREAVQQGRMLIFLFHGVGGEHNLNVSLQAHSELLHFLKENERDLWVAPMIDVAKYIGQQQARAAFARSRDSLYRISEADHKRMMGLLQISSLRPGVDGNNPAAPNAANYDEAKANPYPALPDPLLLKNGKRVKNAATWQQKKRAELLEDFDREVYGRTPKNIPPVRWQVLSTEKETQYGVPVVTKKLIGRVDNAQHPEVVVNLELTVTLPAAAAAPVPVIMEFAWNLPAWFQMPRDTVRHAPPSWQQQVLQRGWGYAVYYPYSVQPDHGAGLSSGIIGLVNKGKPRKPDDWGALKAWAWGASRALDYFETDPAVDAKKVGIEGHSRFGKAALVAMAYDTRFAAAFISSSGAGGAKLHRRNAGEVVENVAAPGEYHWMAGNYLKYAGPLQWSDLPVDAHELIALCAPRPVFISSGNVGDAWVDARGMFLAAAAAGPVYRLLGKKDLGTTEFPSLETPLMNGEVAFRQHNGGHTPGPNWPFFLDFAARYFNRE